MRTPGPGLVWYAGIHSRSSAAIDGLHVLSDYHGTLVRDDYAGWYQFAAQLAGIQQCSAHVIRHLRGVANLDPKVQAWAGRLIELLREAHHAVVAATAAGKDRLDAESLADLRTRYDTDVQWGRLTNRCRPGRTTRTTPPMSWRSGSPRRPTRSGSSARISGFLDEQPG
ncbi:hypothetical protein BCD48_44910 [Pseudofrankia sp. BMG5.36]|nr:hypothetical protein BCD48_44910 [Pseudofrankia sp. BMG5.36]